MAGVEISGGRTSVASAGRRFSTKAGGVRGSISGWAPPWIRRASTKSSVVGDLLFRRGVSTASDGGLDNERAMLASKMQGLMKGHGAGAGAQPRFMLDPDTRAMRAWAFAQGVVQLAHWVLVPMRVGFDLGTAGTLGNVEHLLDALLWLDIALHFRTSARVLGNKVSDPRAVGARYLRSWFVLDVTSALPLDGLLWLAARLGSSLLPPPTSPLSRVPRLLRVRALANLDIAAPVLGLRDHLLRIVRLGLLTLLLFHLGACGWFLVSLLSGFGETAWAAPAAMHGYPLERRYFMCLYWSVGMMTGLVSGEVPERMHEHVFSLSTMTAGVFVYGTVVASVASLVAEGASPQLAFRGRVVRTQRMLRTQRDAGALESRSNAYFDFLWSSRRGAANGIEALHCLPEGLRIDVLLALSSSTLRPVPWLANADEGFDRTLASRLTLGLYMPAEAVDERMHANSMPRGVFFVHRGRVQVRVRGVVLRDMSVGDHFGIVVALAALYMDAPPAGAPKQPGATARQTLERAAREPIAHVAVTSAEIFELSLTDFLLLMRAFPRVRARVTAFAVTRAGEYAQQARHARAMARAIEFAERLQSAARRSHAARALGDDSDGAKDGRTDGRGARGCAERGLRTSATCAAFAVRGASETTAVLEEAAAKARDELRMIHGAPQPPGERRARRSDDAAAHTPLVDARHASAAKQPPQQRQRPQRPQLHSQQRQSKATPPGAPPPPHPQPHAQLRGIVMRGTLKTLSVDPPPAVAAGLAAFAEPSVAREPPPRRTTLTGLPAVGEREVRTTLVKLRAAPPRKVASRLGTRGGFDGGAAADGATHARLPTSGAQQPAHLLHNARSDMLEWVALAGDAASSQRSVFYTAAGFVFADARGVVSIPLALPLLDRALAARARLARWLLARFGRGARASATVQPAVCAAVGIDALAGTRRTPTLHWPVVLPRSRAHRTWVSLLCALLAYHALTTPFMLGFGDAFSRATSASSSSGAMARFLDLMSYALLWVDMAVNAFCAAFTDEDGLTEVRPLYIVRRYWRSGRGKLDLLSVLPYADIVKGLTELVALARGTPGGSTFGAACRVQSFCALRLLRLPVLLRVPQLYHLERERFEGLRGSVLESATHTFARLTAIFLYLTHLCACAYFIVAREGGTCGLGDWSPPAALCDSSISSWAEQYVRCLFWGLAGISGLGVRDEPSTTAQYMFTVAVFLIGLVARAHLIGHVGVLLLELDPTEAHHNKRRAAVMRQLDHSPRELDPSIHAALTQRVGAYFDYVLDAQHGVSMESVLGETDSRVRKLVSAHMGSAMVRKVPLLSGCDESTLAQIGRVLVVRGYPQGEFLIHKARARAQPPLCSASPHAAGRMAHRRDGAATLILNVPPHVRRGRSARRCTLCSAGKSRS